MDRVRLTMDLSTGMGYLILFNVQMHQPPAHLCENYQWEHKGAFASSKAIIFTFYPLRTLSSGLWGMLQPLGNILSVETICMYDVSFFVEGIEVEDAGDSIKQLVPVYAEPGMDVPKRLLNIAFIQGPQCEREKRGKFPTQRSRRRQAHASATTGSWRTKHKDNGGLYGSGGDEHMGPREGLLVGTIQLSPAVSPARHGQSAEMADWLNMVESEGGAEEEGPSNPNPNANECSDEAAGVVPVNSSLAAVPVAVAVASSEGQTVRSNPLCTPLVQAEQEPQFGPRSPSQPPLSSSSSAAVRAVDSIQTGTTAALSGSPPSYSQVRDQDKSKGKFKGKFKGMNIFEMAMDAARRVKDSLGRKASRTAAGVGRFVEELQTRTMESLNRSVVDAIVDVHESMRGGCPRPLTSDLRIQASKIEMKEVRMRIRRALPRILQAFEAPVLYSPLVALSECGDAQPIRACACCSTTTGESSGTPGEAREKSTTASGAEGTTATSSGNDSRDKKPVDGTDAFVRAFGTLSARCGGCGGYLRSQDHPDVFLQDLLSADTGTGTYSEQMGHGEQKEAIHEEVSMSRLRAPSCDVTSRSEEMGRSGTWMSVGSDLGALGEDDGSTPGINMNAGVYKDESGRCDDFSHLQASGFALGSLGAFVAVLARLTRVLVLCARVVPKVIPLMWLLLGRLVLFYRDWTTALIGIIAALCRVPRTTLALPYTGESAATLRYRLERETLSTMLKQNAIQMLMGSVVGARAGHQEPEAVVGGTDAGVVDGVRGGSSGSSFSAVRSQTRSSSGST